MAILGTALVWLGTAPAQAALVDLTVTGEVTEVGPGVAGAFSVGQSMSATFTYDSETPGPIGFGTTKTYLGAVVGGGFDIDGYVGNSFPPGRIRMADDDPTVDDQFRLNAFVTGASVLTHIPVFFDVFLGDATQTAFSSLDLPLTLPDLASLTERRWQLSFTPIPLLDVEPFAFVGGRLTTLEVSIRAVPGPAAWLLVLAGCALLVRHGRGRPQEADRRIRASGG
jgi:hypothetical protein